jgi:hypothetical protein
MKHLSDFEIIRELGRGGICGVSEALAQSVVAARFGLSWRVFGENC